MANFFEIFKNLNLDQVQDSTEEMRKKLSSIQEEGEAGVGLVRATMNGHYKVVSFSIDDSLLHKEKKEVLCDLLVAAVNNAMEKVRVRGKDLTLGTFMDMLQEVFDKAPTPDA